MDTLKSEAEALLQRAELSEPCKLRRALEKGYGGRVEEIRFGEKSALLDE